MDGYKFDPEDKDNNYMFFLKMGLLDHVAEDYDRDRLCEIYTEMLSEYLDKPELSWFETFALPIVKRVYTSPEMSDADKMYTHAKHIVDVMEEYTVKDLMTYMKIHYNLVTYLHRYHKDHGGFAQKIITYDWDSLVDWFNEKYTLISLCDLEAEITAELSEFIVYRITGKTPI